MRGDASMKYKIIRPPAMVVVCMLMIPSMPLRYLKQKLNNAQIRIIDILSKIGGMESLKRVVSDGYKKMYAAAVANMNRGVVFSIARIEETVYIIAAEPMMMKISVREKNDKVSYFVGASSSAATNPVNKTNSMGEKLSLNKMRS
jgi:predicted DNA-binding ArsR family transcriptional regulator